MSSSSEDEESLEESSCSSEWSDDGERSSHQEETDQDEDAEKYRHDRGEPKVTSRGKQERRIKRKVEDRTSGLQELDQEEESRPSHHNSQKPKHSLDGEEPRMAPGDEDDERKGKRKKIGGVRGGESSSKKVAGIIHLSRVPPFMKPHKVKHLLSRYGSVGRVYLKPEDSIVRQRRVKFKGNKKKNFTEGWVEFHDKRVAKAVALMLNNTPIGGKKRSYYHDDLWNIKYLSKFRWTHLTEKIAYEQAVREQKMRTEISQAKRENSHYLSSVEKRKEIEAIVQRKRKRGATDEDVTKLQRQYKQRRVTETSRGTDQFAEKSQSSFSDAKIHLSDSLLKKILPG